MSIEAAARLLDFGYRFVMNGQNIDVREIDGQYVETISGDRLCGALLDKLAENRLLPRIEHYWFPHESRWECVCFQHAGRYDKAVAGRGPTRLAAVLELVGELEGVR